MRLAGCGTRAAPPPAPRLPPPAGRTRRAAALSGSRWVAVGFEQLPGWQADRAGRSLAGAAEGLRAAARRPGPRCAPRRAQAAPGDDAATRQWLMQRLQPYRVEAADGNAEGLLTGYFEPLVEASRTRRGAYRCRCTRRRPTWPTRKPYWTRQQLDTLPAAQAALRGREIA